MTVPDWVGASEPVSVQTIAPAVPTAGCVVALHAVMLAGSGAPHTAETNVVKAGVASLMTMVASGSAPLLL